LILVIGVNGVLFPLNEFLANIDENLFLSLYLFYMFRSFFGLVSCLTTEAPG